MSLKALREFPFIFFGSQISALRLIDSGWVQAPGSGALETIIYLTTLKSNVD